MATVEVTVRPATHKDCDDIKAIDRNIYEDDDRFYQYFHRDIHTKTSFPYIAELNGKIIGYLCGHVIDDGQSLVLREGRVHEEYRRQGVMSKITTDVVKEARSHFPTLQRGIWTSGDIELQNKIMAAHPRIRMVYHGNAEFAMTSVSALWTAYNSQSFSQLQQQHRHIVDAITGIPKRQALHLLTREICVLDYAPEKLIIGWEPSGWEWKTLAEYFQYTDLFISKDPKSQAINAFCLYCTNDTDSGKRIIVTVYCRSGAENLVVAYLLYSIRELIYLNGDHSVKFSFLFPLEINKKVIKLALNEKLGIPSNVNFEYTTNILEQPSDHTLELGNL